MKIEISLWLGLEQKYWILINGIMHKSKDNYGLLWLLWKKIWEGIIDRCNNGCGVRNNNESFYAKSYYADVNCLHHVNVYGVQAHWRKWQCGSGYVVASKIWWWRSHGRWWRDVGNNFYSMTLTRRKEIWLATGAIHDWGITFGTKELRTMSH